MNDTSFLELSNHAMLSIDTATFRVLKEPNPDTINISLTASLLYVASFISLASTSISCAIQKLIRPLRDIIQFLNPSPTHLRLRCDFPGASYKILLLYDISYFDWIKFCHDSVTFVLIPNVSLAHCSVPKSCRLGIDKCTQQTTLNCTEHKNK